MLKWKWRWPHIHVTIIPLQERHFVTLAIFLLATGMLLMARENPDLWEIDLFTIILQAVVISGIIGSILAFHFAANKKDVVEVEAAGRASELEAARQRQPLGVKEAAVEAASEVKDAAVDAADKIADDAETARGRVTEGR